MSYQQHLIIEEKMHNVTAEQLIKKIYNPTKTKIFSLENNLSIKF